MIATRCPKCGDEIIGFHGCSGFEQASKEDELKSLRTQLAAEIEKRKGAELKLEQIGNLKANEKLLVLWDSIDTGECENNGCIDARLALQKSEAEKLELAEIVKLMDETICEHLGYEMHNEKAYTKSKAIIEKGK